MEPKVLVGCPTADYKEYCLKEYLEGLRRLSYSNFDVLIVDNSKDERYAEKIRKEGFKVIKDECLPNAKDRIVHSRNLVREYALKNGYDYLFSLEQDVIPPEDIIERLIESNKKIIAGLYYTEYKFNGVPNIRPLMWKKAENDAEKIRFMNEEAESGEIVEVDVTGLGCILIHKDVLKKIKFRIEGQEGTFDDVYFCRDAAEKGFTIYVDTKLKCKHLIRGMEWEKIENEEKSRKKQ